MRDYQYFAKQLTGRCKDSRKLCNHTYLCRRDADSVAIQLHSTDVVTYYADGRITFKTGGWYSATTKARMNEYSPAQIWQKKGNWFINLHGHTVEFFDGMTWCGSQWLRESEADDAARIAAKYVAMFSADEHGADVSVSAALMAARLHGEVKREDIPLVRELARGRLGLPQEVKPAPELPAALIVRLRVRKDRSLQPSLFSTPQLIAC